MPMPLIKIGYLLLRTLAKPIGSALKRQAKERPAFRAGCVRVAQWYHRIEVRMLRRIAAKNGHGSLAGEGEAAASAKIKPLQEQKAIDLGAEFLGEALIFGVAGAILLAEASRNHQAEMARRRVIEEKFESLFSDLQTLHGRLRALEEEKILKIVQPEIDTKKI